MEQNITLLYKRAKVGLHYYVMQRKIFGGLHVCLNKSSETRSINFIKILRIGRIHVRQFRRMPFLQSDFRILFLHQFHRNSVFLQIAPSRYHAQFRQNSF